MTALAIATRCVQFAAVLVLFGSASFLLYTCQPLPGRRPGGARGAGPAGPDQDPAPAAQAAPGGTWLRWLWPLAAAAGSAATLAWLCGEAAALTGSWKALADVISGTHFGTA
ncbi:MAG TPA: hypothetical protein VMB48_01155, partial [Steroidobacteraceae bacterium]|nr:hypothetical protein [Steroidobacteraceae bacterium]